jgi:diguanylate cyclase (GGDEF)-like protein
VAAEATPGRIDDGAATAPPGGGAPSSGAGTPRSDATTHRFTVAWILALVAIGLIATTGWMLVDGTLVLQREAAAVARTVGTQVAVIDTLEQEVVAVGEARTGPRARSALAGARETLPRFEALHHRLTVGDPATGLVRADRAEVGPAVADIERTGAVLVEAVTILGDAVDGLGSDDAGPHVAALVEDGVAAVATAGDAYRRALAELAAEYDRLAADRVDEARAIDRSMLLATLALLVVEALLVFRPATRRVRETLESRRREAESDRRHAAEQLAHLARHDPLTGLANRLSFRDRLDHAVAGAQRSGKQVAVMFLDLDRFKEVNDTYGHEVGDELLVVVADRLRNVARRADTIGRLGGDEFVLLLEGLDDPEGAATVAAKVLESLSSSIDIGARRLRVTTSIGIALYPDDADDVDDLLRHADSAMYEAKSAGRDTFRFSTPELRAVNVRRLRLVAELRAAVAGQRLRLVDQPQVAVTTGELLGVEAFVRWVRPDGTEVRAGDFISVLEDTDLMAPLGAWVLEEACRQNVAWQLEGLPSLRVAINLSGQQFRQRDLATTIAGALETSGMRPDLLELEVTEASLVQDPDTSAATLRVLKGLGVRLVIDDFGTGYSSLSYLKRFPIDVLKIDGSFVHRIDRNEDEDRAIPAAIAGIARHLGMETTAEGVESGEQLEFLRGIGCDRAQGYHVSRPLEPADVVAFAARPPVRPGAGLEPV